MSPSLFVIMMNFNRVLLTHIKEFPLMEPTDAVKLAYQNEFGPAHMISDLKGAAEMIERERAIVGTTNAPLFSSIGNGYARFNLSSYDANGFSTSLIARVFAASVKESTTDTKGTMGGFLKKIDMIRDLSRDGVFSFTVAELDGYLAEYAKAEYPTVSHSVRYKEAYKPSYRVIKESYIPLLPLLSAIEKQNNSSGKPVLIAIDGHAAAGKTTLAKKISSVFDCNVFHMDDFFLPPSLRTKERLEEVGGNVHYERFMEEVITPLKKGKSFSYGVFDCSTMQINGNKEVEVKKLNIIEGSYSFHPYFDNPYDIRIFLDIAGDEQRKRITLRNGPEMAERFRREWIPMENRYFDSFRIRESCDFALQQPLPKCEK